MNELFINTTFYYVLAIIVYVYLIITSVLLVSDKSKSFITTKLHKLKDILEKQKVYMTIRDDSIKYFFRPVHKIFLFLRWKLHILTYLLHISNALYKAEEFVVNNILPELLEPVNYCSLIIRKFYTDSQTAIITVMAAFIVVFYFILSIF